MSSTTRRARAVDRPVVTARSTSSISPSSRWNSARCHQLWTAKKLSLRPGVGVGAHPGDAVALPALHLHARAPPRAAPSRRAARARRRGGPAPRRARSRRSPRGRRRACRASRGSRACAADHAGSARAMRSRSMRASPVKKSIWWPACSASASRGCCDGDVLEHAARLVPAALRQLAERCDMRRARARCRRAVAPRRGQARATAVACARCRARRASPSAHAP